MCIGELNRGRERPRLRCGFLTVATMALVLPANAQVIPTPRELVMPPWNALQVLEPTPLPILTDPDQRDDVAPEDMPVGRRARPEYAPRGIRSGSWLFNPTLTAGALYDSNVFSSDTNRQSDIAGLLGASLRARNSSERSALDFQMDVQSLSYLEHSKLNEVDATFKGNGRFELQHDLELLTAIRAAYSHVGVGTLTSPAGAVEPTPYSLFSGGT